MRRLKEHRALVSLISEKRPDEAEEVLRRHLQSAKDHYPQGARKLLPGNPVALHRCG